MQAAKYILSVILVAAMLLPGLPVFSPEDASRDSKVDLKDAILNVMELARSAENPGAFASSMEKALATLNVLAGYRTVIKSQGTAKSKATSLSIDLPFLICTNLLSGFSPCYAWNTQTKTVYRSFVKKPTPPPPRSAFLS